MTDQLPDLPIGDFYELSSRLGYTIGVGKFHEKRWVLSTGAQLSLLHTLARLLKLKEAEDVLWPMVRDRCDEAGDIISDHLYKAAQ